LYGISGGLFTPMKSGEYFARAIPYKNVKVVDVVLATMVDKIIPLYFVLLFGGIFAAVYLYQIIHLSFFTVVSLLIVYLMILLITPYLLLGNSPITKRIKNYLTQKRYFVKILPKIMFLKGIDKNTLYTLAGLSIFFNLIFTVQMTILLISFSGEMNLWLFFVISNLIIFVQIIIPPIALGEIGIREGASVFFMKSFGYAGVIGFNAAFSLFIINLLIPSIFGFLLLLKRDKV
ncbi:MAG: flippase-like domain-containing protein, partial [Melioribacteraceae bacterium]|nr:flippase-like domain-containing protein [Melioribacteraceae bacterium]